MGCIIIALLSLIAPRLTIILIVIFSDYIGRAYDTVLWPLLGFIFLPLTTLAYAWGWHSTAGDPWQGGHAFVIVLALLIDLGLVGGGGHAGSRKKRD
ncbi:MAG: hypothetical protein ACOC0P_05835 [Planctomycetota bacterium]